MMHTIYLMGIHGDKHLSFPLQPELDTNSHPVSIKPFKNTGNARLHFIQYINHPPGLPVPRPTNLVIQRFHPLHQFDAQRLDPAPIFPIQLNNRQLFFEELFNTTLASVS